MATNQGQQIPHEALPDNDDLEVDNDSTYGSVVGSDTTSLKSNIIRGYVENGRRYQTVREGKEQVHTTILVRREGSRNSDTNFSRSILYLLTTNNLRG